jgi:hypothetical protein
MLINSGGTAESAPTGSGELTPDKPHKSGVRWSKNSGLHDGGTVDEAGTSNPSGMRGCQNHATILVTEEDRRSQRGNQAWRHV